MRRTQNYRWPRPEQEDFYDIDQIGEAIEGADAALFQKADLDGERMVPREQIPPLDYLSLQLAERFEARLSRLESMIINNVTQNAFLIAFDGLGEVLVEGTWNRTLGRIEF